MSHSSLMISPVIFGAAPKVEVYNCSWDFDRGDEPRREIESYLSYLSEEYQKTLADLVLKTEPMHQECKVSVCIPVAAHEEEHFIGRTLRSFLTQTAKFESFEIVLLANHPVVGPTGEPVVPDGTLDEIAKFKRAHPEMNVRLMYANFNPNEAVISNIRGVLNDAVLLRHLRREVDPLQDHILVRLDADIGAVSDNYIENYIKRFAANPEVDCFAGQLDWMPTEVLAAGPHVLITERIGQIVQAHRRIKIDGLLWTSGTNAAVRASSYALVGGYSRELRQDEDHHFDGKLYSYRQLAECKVARGYAGSPSRVYVSPRRGILAVHEGLSAVEQWSCQGLNFAEFNPRVRKAPPQETFSPDRFVRDLTDKDFLHKAEYLINRTIEFLAGRLQTQSPTADSPAVNRALSLLGIEHVVLSDRAIRITNGEKLKNRLLNYVAEVKSKISAKTRSIGLA